MKTLLYRASNLKLTSLFWPLMLNGSHLLAPVKTVNSCDLFIIIIIIIIIIHFFARVFLECTEAVASSLIPLVTKFLEICAFIIGFSVSV